MIFQVVGAHVASEAPTPLAVGQSFEHDAVIEQFKNLHGRVNKHFQT